MLLNLLSDRSRAVQVYHRCKQNPLELLRQVQGEISCLCIVLVIPVLFICRYVITVKPVRDLRLAAGMMQGRMSQKLFQHPLSRCP